MEFLTFHVGEREFAVDMSRVREIVAPPPISRVPDVPPALLGLAGLRGEPTAVIDAGLRLDARAISINGRTPLLVLHVRQEDQSFNVGLLVEAAGRQLELLELLPWTEGLARFAGADACTGFADVDGKMVIVLDVDQLLDFRRVRAALPASTRTPAAALPAPADGAVARTLDAAGGSSAAPTAIVPAGAPPGTPQPTRDGAPNAFADLSRPREHSGAHARRPRGDQEARPERPFHSEPPSSAEDGAGALRAAPPRAAARALAAPTDRPRHRPSPEPIHAAAHEAPAASAGLPHRAPVVIGHTAPARDLQPPPPPVHPSHRSAVAPTVQVLEGAPEGRPAAAAPIPTRPLDMEATPAVAVRSPRWLVAVAAIALLLLAVVFIASRGGCEAERGRPGTGPASRASTRSASASAGAGAAAERRTEEHFTPPATTATVLPPPPPEPRPTPPAPAAAPPPPPPVRPPEPAPARPQPKTAAPTPRAPEPPVSPPAPTKRTARPLPPSMVVTPDTPACEIHEVAKGDTLWWIAARRLGSPYKWPRLFGENRDVIVDPNVIEVHDRIRVPGGCRGPAAR